MDLTDLIIISIISFIVLGIIFFLANKLQSANSEDEKTLSSQNQLLINQIKNFKDVFKEDDLIHIYEKSKSQSETPSYTLLKEIISRLIKLKAFPKTVTVWLDDPADFEKDVLLNVMEEFIATRQGTLKDDVAISAYIDGFITSPDEVLRYVDKTKYPKTIQKLLSEPEAYYEIRDLLEEEAQQYK